MKNIDRARILKDEGIKLADEAGKPKEAIVKLKEAISLIMDIEAHCNELTELHFLIAMISLNLENMDQAWDYFTEALKTNANKNISLANRCNLNLGLKLYSDNKYAAAINKFKDIKGLEGLNPLQIDMYYTMVGVSFIKLEKYRTALKYLFKALALPYEDDRSFEVFYHIGCIYFKKKKYKNALKYYEESINKYPDQPESFKQLTLLRMAYMYMYREEYQKAIRVCDEIEQKKDINIRLEQLYISKGRCHSKLGQVMQALKYFEKAWELKDQLTDGWRESIKQWLIEYYIKVGNLERVEELRES